MALYSEKNQYPGVNAHLQSLFQSKNDGWEDFHSRFITHLGEALGLILPPGYFAFSERSIQLLATDWDDQQTLDRIRADVAIFQRESVGVRPSGGGVALAPDAPRFLMPLIETLADEDELQSVVIYAPAPDHPRGRPVTRIELLSPANKPPGSHFLQYTAKRDTTLQAGINLVEIDLLHQQRPIMDRLPSYPDGDEGASPYWILVSTPHPTWQAGQAAAYPFGVEDRVPIVRVPLAGSDEVITDFGAIYQRTFASNPYYAVVAVDYARDPAAFDSYRPDDQQRIRQRMSLIAQELTP